MNSPSQVAVGIVSAGMYIPERVLSVADIAQASGLPGGWFVTSWASTRNARVGPDDLPDQMAVRAGHQLGVGCHLRQMGTV